MKLPEEKGVQTHFKEHLFSFTRRDGTVALHFKREINIRGASGVCFRATLSFTARKESYFYYCHVYYNLCCISLLHCVLLSTVQMLNA